MLLSLSFLSLLSVAFASQHIPRHPHPKRASDANTGPDKFSLYDAGLGACGGTNTDSEFVVALNIPQWDNGANCYKEITITYNGKTTNAQIVDQCQICPDGGLDLSRGLFTFFEDPSVGIIHGGWSFVGATLTTTSSSTTKTTSTSTTHTTTSTSSTLTATSTSTQATTSTTKTTSASSSVPSSATATSSNTVATPTSSESDGPQVIAQFSDTLVNMLELVREAVQAAHA